MSAPTRRRVRGLVFAAVALWMVGGPLYRQVLGGGFTGLPAWRMYHLRGLDTVEVVFEVAEADGHRRRIDRLATLGRARGTLRDRLVIGRKGLDAAARELCGRLGRDVDLRARARLAVATGWTVLEDGERNLCEAVRR